MSLLNISVCEFTTLCMDDPGPGKSVSGKFLRLVQCMKSSDHVMNSWDRDELGSSTFMEVEVYLVNIWVMFITGKSREKNDFPRSWSRKTVPRNSSQDLSSSSCHLQAAASTSSPSSPPPSLELAIFETSNVPASAYTYTWDFFPWLFSIWGVIFILRPYMYF